MAPGGRARCSPLFTFIIVSLGRFGIAGWLVHQKEIFYSLAVGKHIHVLAGVHVALHVFVAANVVAEVS
jgi:hypothetical protein